MHNDDKLIGTILTRRDALRAASVAGVTLLLGSAEAMGGAPQLASQGRTVEPTNTGTDAQAQQAETATGSAQTGQAVHLVATPAVEEGPFFVDENLNRKDVTTGTDRKSVVDGSPLTLRLTLLAIRSGEATPIRGAHIDIWHADAAGTYSDEASGGIQGEDTRGQKWLRGYQVTDAKGIAEIRTIYPGWYPSRTVHVHVKVRTYDAASNKTHEFTTQLYFDDKLSDAVLSKAPYNGRGARKVRNADDGLYNYKQADGTMIGSHLHLDTSNPLDSGGRIGAFSLALKMD